MSWSASLSTARRWKNETRNGAAKLSRGPRGSVRRRSNARRDLADRLGWSKSKYASVETGERRLDVIEFKHIAKALKVDPADLFRRWVNW